MSESIPERYIPSEFTTWIVLSAGEGHQEFASYEEAMASAKEQAEDIPNLVLAVYRLEHFVSAMVRKPKVFTPKHRPSKKAQP